MRIVALVPGGIGEQILFFPTLDQLKRYYPKAEIDVVAEKNAIDAYRVCKSVQDPLRFDFKDRNSMADWVNLIGTLRDREYDIAISLGQNWASGLLLWLTGIPNRVGYKGPATVFLTNSVPLKTQQYAAAMYHDLLQSLGINSPCPEIAINVPKADIDWAESEQKRLGIQDGYVLIYAASSQSQVSPAKGTNNIYPLEKWQRIIQDFQQRQPELPLVLIQTPDEQQLVSALLQSYPRIKVTSPPDIGKLAAMIAGANLMLCTDSVPMHLAVALQIYTIALFGSADPQKLLPKSDRFLAVKSPTGRMADIPPADVMERVWRG